MLCWALLRTHSLPRQDAMKHSTGHLHIKRLFCRAKFGAEELLARFTESAYTRLTHRRQNIYFWLKHYPPTYVCAPPRLTTILFLFWYSASETCDKLSTCKSLVCEIVCALRKMLASGSFLLTAGGE